MPRGEKLSEKVEKALKNLGPNFVIRLEYDEPGKEYEGDKIWRISLARERIRKYFLNHREFEALLFIDSDLLIPQETFKVLSSIDADIISHRYESKFPLKIMRKIEKEDLGIQVWKEENKKAWITSGMGCVLIKRKVLEKCDFISGIKKEENKIGEDILFRRKALDNGFKIVNLEDRLDLKHLPYNLETCLKIWCAKKRSR